MKIAILTQPLGKNYGGILQAYALQQILQSLGHEAVIINRVDNYPSFKLLIWRFASFVKCFIAKYLKNDRSIRLISPLSLEYITDTRLVYDYSELNEFIYRNIIRTKEIRSSNKLRRYLLRNGYEAIVVGSDQVWREEYSPCITDFFGGFLQNNDRLKLIAYAASFGLDIEVIEESGLSQDKKFVVEVSVVLEDKTVLKLGRGEGRNKKAAQEAAAKDAYKRKAGQ